MTNALGIDYPSGDTVTGQERRKKAQEMMHAAVSKRNMLFTLDDTIANVTAAWVPSLPMPTRPIRGSSDS